MFVDGFFGIGLVNKGSLFLGVYILYFSGGVYFTTLARIADKER